MTEIEYDSLQYEISELLGGTDTIVFSTSAKDRVTSRTVCFVNCGNEIYILTGKRTLKCRQLAENCNISLCTGNLQIEGLAELTGHPSEIWHQEINELFKSRHKFYYERFAHFKAAVYIKVNCKSYKLWKFADGKDGYYCLDIDKQKAFFHR